MFDLFLNIKLELRKALPSSIGRVVYVTTFENVGFNSVSLFAMLDFPLPLSPTKTIIIAIAP